MKRILLVSSGIAAFVAASAIALPAWSQLEPVTESFTEDQRTAARERAEVEEASGFLDQCGGSGGDDADASRRTEGGEVLPDAPVLGEPDNDATHYARGTTLVVHIFVDHTAGSWSLAERQDQGVKAANAKQYFLDQGPAGAWIRWDNQGSTAYTYYQVTLPYALPLDAEMSNDACRDAVEILGFDDVDGDGTAIDDMSQWLQGWSGGWDNVILMFEAADNERSVARVPSYDLAWCKVPPAVSWYTMAHEWGHIFGACDEYSSSLTDCNGIYCDEVCQSWYLNDDVTNGNCESDPCGALMNCLMTQPVWTGTPCPYTVRNWAWVDSDDDGLLDTTLRNDDGTLYNLFDLYHNGYFIHTNTDWGMVANQRWTSWSTIGLRSRGTSDYDLRVYGENNRNHFLASSLLTGQEVDFVVGDFNHNRLGEDHIRITRDVAGGQYVLTYEGGTGMLFPDGVDRAQTWEDYNVVRTYDVPLFAGETITFQLDISTAALDMGMALFRSNGSTYYAGRAGAQWEEDDWPAGISESYTYVVPADDVYGLVVWSNTEVDGNWSIKIGPTPFVLAEETPSTSFLDLRLYSYAPSVSYWAVSGSRPSAGTNVLMNLFEESTYETELATSGAYVTEFIAADYNPGWSNDYLRLVRQGGVGSYITEWEQSADLMNGFESGNWTAGHVCKVWDAYLLGGQTYQFRQYNNGSALDGGIYVMSSAGGDRYVQRSGAAAGSNSHPPAEGGEWFTYTPPADDWYGAVLIANDESSGSYSFAVGPRVSLTDNVPVSYPDELIWADFPTQNGSWAVAGVRADPGVTARAHVWSCSSYGIECFRVSDAGSTDVSYVVLDNNHLAAGTYYPRFERLIGVGDLTVSCDVAGPHEIAFDGSPEAVAANGAFAAGEVVQVWDLNVTGTPMTIHVGIIPLVAGLDVGVALHSSASGDYDQGSISAVASAEAAGPGGAELITIDLASNDVYGLVITNENGTAGGYRIQILDDDSSLTSVSTTPPALLAFRATGGNPDREGGARFELSLPSATEVSLDIYDVRGRLVRGISRGPLEGGTHLMAWDGRDDAGRNVSAGLYMARLAAGSEVRTIKVIQAE